MVQDTGGYNGKNVEEGFGHPQCENYTCVNCGKYVEIVPETVVPPEFKFNDDCELTKRLKKATQDPWLQKYVEQHWEEIEGFRQKKLIWKDICKKLAKRDCLNLSPEAINGAYRKVRRKLWNAQHATALAR